MQLNARTGDIKLFIFTKSTIAGNVYLDMLELYTFPQIHQIEHKYNVQVIFQQDSMLPHYRLEVDTLLIRHFLVFFSILIILVVNINLNFFQGQGGV